jgi:hypothetical protein
VFCGKNLPLLTANAESGLSASARPGLHKEEVRLASMLRTSETSSRRMRFTLYWAYLGSTIKPSSDTRRGKWVGKEEESWPGTCK